MKKGEISSSELVTVIILVLSFAVVLLFLFLYPWGETIDKETCHQSIVLRHTANVGDFGAEIVPFKCQTGKICFVSGLFQDCDEFEGVSGVEKVTINNKEEAKKEIAGLMYNCWDMLGRGYLNYHPTEGSNWEGNVYCSPCYRIAFSEQTQEKIKEINYYELYEWMAGNKIPNSDKTYLEVVYGINDYDLYKQKLFEASPEKNYEVLQNIATSKQQAIIAMMEKQSWAKTVVGGSVGLAVGVGIIIGTGGTGASIVIPALTIAGSIIGSEATEEYFFSPPTILPYEAKSLQALKCGEFDFIP